MKYLVSALMFTVTSLCLSSCGKSREESIKKITDLEARTEKESGSPSEAQLSYDLEVLYTDFAQRFPEDSMAPAYLFKAIDRNVKMGWGDRAVKAADLFLNKYPNDRRAPDALFYKAFVYDNQLNDDVSAGTFYNEFIQKYPKHPFAPSAEASIRNLGKTDEELIREFENGLVGDSLEQRDSAFRPGN